jgi:hypothetical protein
MLNFKNFVAGMLKDRFVQPLKDTWSHVLHTAEGDSKKRFGIFTLHSLKIPFGIFSLTTYDLCNFLSNDKKFFS